MGGGYPFRHPPYFLEVSILRKRIICASLSVLFAVAIILNPFAQARRAEAVVPVAVGVGYGIAAVLGAAGVGMAVSSVLDDGAAQQIGESFQSFCRDGANAAAIGGSMAKAVAHSKVVSATAAAQGIDYEFYALTQGIDSFVDSWAGGTVDLDQLYGTVEGAAILGALDAWLASNSVYAYGSFVDGACINMDAQSFVAAAMSAGYLGSYKDTDFRNEYLNGNHIVGATSVNAYEVMYSALSSNRVYLYAASVAPTACTVANVNGNHCDLLFTFPVPVSSVEFYTWCVSTLVFNHAGDTLSLAPYGESGAAATADAYTASFPCTFSSNSVATYGHPSVYSTSYLKSPYGTASIVATPYAHAPVSLVSSPTIPVSLGAPAGKLGTIPTTGVDYQFVAGDGATRAGSFSALHTGSLDATASQSYLDTGSYDASTATAEVSRGGQVANVPLSGDLSGTSLGTASQSGTGTDAGTGTQAGTGSGAVSSDTSGARTWEDFITSYPEFVRDLQDNLTSVPAVLADIRTYITTFPDWSKSISDYLEQVLANQKTLADYVTGVPEHIRTVHDLLTNISQTLSDQKTSIASWQADWDKAMQDEINSAGGISQWVQQGVQELPKISDSSAGIAKDTNIIAGLLTDDAGKSVPVEVEQHAKSIDNTTVKVLENIQQWNDDSKQFATDLHVVRESVQAPEGSQSTMYDLQAEQLQAMKVEIFPELQKVTPELGKIVTPLTTEVVPELQTQTQTIGAIKTTLDGASTLTEQKVQTKTLSGLLDTSVAVLDATKTLSKTQVGVLERADTISKVLTKVFPDIDAPDNPPTGEDFQRALEPMTHVFPLSAPFDLQRIVQSLDADEMHTLQADLSVIQPGWVITYDFSQWDDAVKVVRGFEIIAWAVGLTLITRNIVAG